MNNPSLIQNFLIDRFEFIPNIKFSNISLYESLKKIHN